MADSNFIDYLQRMSDDYAKSGQKACHTLMESAIKRLIRYKGKNINFNQVGKEYLIGFIDYLNHETNDFDSRKADKGRVQKPLSDVYKEALFARVMVALNKAEREGINAMLSHPRRGQENHRTPYWPKNDVKPAFLFCCFSGLRHSDLLKLTWGEIKQTADIRSRPLYRFQTSRPLQHPHNPDLRKDYRRKQAQGRESRS